MLFRSEDVNVSTSNASIQEVARLAAAFGVAFSPQTKISGQLTLNVHAQGPTDHLSLNGNINGRNLEATGSDIPRPVHVPAIDLTMNPQQIQSNNFTATSGGTTLAAQMTLSQYTGNSPNVDATLKTVNGKVMSCWALPKPTELPPSKASPAPATSPSMSMPPVPSRTPMP